jgi:hypothetical protein
MQLYRKQEVRGHSRDQRHHNSISLANFLSKFAAEDSGRSTPPDFALEKGTTLIEIHRLRFSFCPTTIPVRL